MMNDSPLVSALRCCEGSHSFICHTHAHISICQ